MAVITVIFFTWWGWGQLTLGPLLFVFPLSVLERWSETKKKMGMPPSFCFSFLFLEFCVFFGFFGFYGERAAATAS
jgi:hypothetical protein